MTGGDVDPPAGRRFFIGLATSRYADELDLGDRPELLGAVTRMRALFTGLRYETPEFASDCSARDLQNALSAFLTDPDRLPDDTVVFYYTGHGVVVGGTYFLPMAGTTTDVWRSGLDGDSLAKWLLRGTLVGRFMIILDTCHAGAGHLALSAESWHELAGTAGTAPMPSVTVIAAARPLESAGLLAFTDAFIEAVRHESNGRYEPEFLPVDSILKRVKRRLPPWQNVTWSFAGDPEAFGEYLPNPRHNPYGPDLDLRQRDVVQESLRRAELESHVWPRAQGLDVPMDGRHLFTGRLAAMTELCRWLAGDGGESLVVTGGPGSGKSALLARTYVLSDKVLRGRVPGLDRIPTAAMPVDGAIRRFIHARGKTVEEVLAGLNEAAETTADTVADLLTTLGRRDGPTLTVVVDAVDEASDEQILVRDVLAPIIRNGTQCHLRLLIGTRDHLVDDLGGRSIDIDTEAYADPASVRAYALRCLREIVPDSPYANAPEIAAKVADGVGTAAGKSFLVALITARSLALRAAVVDDPDDVGWRSRLPREAASAMERDISERLGALAGKARDLLVPLAYAEGAGLPWEDVWVLVASELAGRAYRDEDIEWLIRHAGYYIIEARESGRSSYRLYHEALADHLRKVTDRDSAAIERTVQRRFLAGLRATVDGDRWSRAHPYIRRHLASHAGRGGLIDEYLLDPAYLVVADRGRLLTAATRCETSQGRRAALAFQQSTHALTGDGPVRLAYLGLAAHQYGADRLAEQIAASGLPMSWQTRYARWMPPPPHRVVTRQAHPVDMVAIALINGTPAIVAGIGAEIRIWALDSGHAVGKATFATGGHGQTTLSVQPRDGAPVLYQHGDRLYSVTLGTVPPTVRTLVKRLSQRPGPTAIRVGGTVCAAFFPSQGGRQVRFMDADARPARADLDLAELIRIHPGGITAVRHLITLRTANEDYLVTTDLNTVAVWDIATGQLACRWQPAGKRFGRITAGEIDGRPALIAVGRTDGRAKREDETMSEALRGVQARSIEEIRAAANRSTQIVRIWLPPLPGPEELIEYELSEQVSARAVESVDGRTFLVTGGADGGIRIRDLRTGDVEYESARGHAGAVTSIVTHQSPAGSVIVSAGEDGTIRVWDLGIHLPSRELGPQKYQAWTVGLVGSGTTPTVVAGIEDLAGDPTAHQVLIRKAGATEPTILRQPGAPAAILTTVEHDDRRIVLTTAEQDCMVYAWDIDRGFDGSWMAHRRRITALAAAVLGETTIAFTASEDGTVVAWDIARRERRRVVWRRNGDHATALAVLDTGRAALMIGTERGRLLVLDARSGRTLGAPLDLHRPVRAITVDPDHHAALVVTTDGCRGVGLDGPRRRRIRLTTRAFAAVHVTAAARSPAGRWALAEGDRIIVGDRRTGVLGEINLWSAVRSVAIADDGTVAAAAEHGLVLLKLDNSAGLPERTASPARPGLDEVLRVTGSLEPGSLAAGDREPALAWEPDPPARSAAGRRPADYTATDDMWVRTGYDSIAVVASVARLLVVALLGVLVLAAGAAVWWAAESRPATPPAAYDIARAVETYCRPASPLFTPTVPICVLTRG